MKDDRREIEVGSGRGADGVAARIPRLDVVREEGEKMEGYEEGRG